MEWPEFLLPLSIYRVPILYLLFSMMEQAWPPWQSNRQTNGDTYVHLLTCWYSFMYMYISGKRLMQWTICMLMNAFISFKQVWCSSVFIWMARLLSNEKKPEDEVQKWLRDRQELFLLRDLRAIQVQIYWESWRRGKWDMTKREVD